MNNLGKVLISIGLFFVVIGVLISLSAKLKLPFLGKLPGDIIIEKKNFTFYAPLTTSILLSMAISLFFYFFSKK